MRPILMSDLQTVMLAATAVINLGLSLFIFTRNRTAPANISFALFALCLALWAVAIIGFREASSIELAKWLLAVSYVSAALIGACFYYFSLVYPEGVLPHRWHVTAIAVIAGAACLAALTPGFLIEAVVGDGATRSANLGLSGYLIFAAGFLALFVGGQLRLWWKFVNAEGLLRTQILVVSASVTVIGLIGMYYNLLLPSPYVRDFRFVWTGPLFTSAFALIITYSTYRFRLFNARALLAEVLVFSLWLIMFLRTFVAGSRDEAWGNAGVLALSVPIGLLLLRSVAREIKALETANEHLKELDQLKSEFVSIASHQLRGPVTVIRGYVSLMRDGSFGPLAQDMREPVDRIEESATVLAGAIDDYLNVSRIEEGRMEYSFDNADLAELVRRVTEEHEPAARKANLQLSFVYDGAGPCRAKVDKGKITQVLINLLDNAIKYTPQGSIAVRVSRDTERGMIGVSIRDTGLGIEKEAIPQLFEKFRRAGGAHRANKGGSGIGLYIARLLVEAHGGRMWAESEGKDKGSTFSFELPEAA